MWWFEQKDIQEIVISLEITMINAFVQKNWNSVDLLINYRGKKKITLFPIMKNIYISEVGHIKENLSKIYVLKYI